MDSLIQTIKEARTPAGVIELERQMLQYIRTLNSDKIHAAAGWSKFQRRWHADTPINRLRTQYWSLLHHCDHLKHTIEQKQEEFEKNCTHVWAYDHTNRDERSRYLCTTCGKSR